MKHVIPLFLLFLSCKDHLAPIKKSVYYRLAVKDLQKYHIPSFEMIRKEELESREFLIYDQDTVLLRLSKRLFGFRDAKKNIYIYQFYQNRAFNRYILDKDWKPVSMGISTGEGVYEED